jgi:hypothetical protein
MDDDRQVMVVDGTRRISAGLDDVLDQRVRRVSPSSDFDLAPSHCAALIADRDMELLEGVRAAGFAGPLVLVTDRSRAPRLRARRSGIAIYTRPISVERIARTLRAALSQNIPPRLECASCLTTTNLEPRSVSSVVFFCDDCRAVAAADPADPMVDIGGPGPG